TTHSQEFLGLKPDVWRDANHGEGTVIAVIDTGIDPDHVSFAGNPMPNPPAEWKESGSSRNAGGPDSDSHLSCIWFHSGVYGCIQVLMVAFTCIWLHSDAYGCIQVHMVAFRLQHTGSGVVKSMTKRKMTQPYIFEESN
ncbi:hypothetical protein Taro_035642, partial [Colocasia esculenta]|nr:hypothetical protein [Colocasia esculenta]